MHLGRQKAILESLLEDCDIELTRLHANVEANTTKVILLESTLLEKYELVETLHLQQFDFKRKVKESLEIGNK